MQVSLTFSLYDVYGKTNAYTLYSIDLQRHTAPTVGSEVCLMYQFEDYEDITSVHLKVRRVVYYPYFLADNPLLKPNKDSQMCVQVSLGTYREKDPEFDHLVQVMNQGNQMKLRGQWKSILVNGKETPGVHDNRSYSRR